MPAIPLTTLSVVLLLVPNSSLKIQSTKIYLCYNRFGSELYVLKHSLLSWAYGRSICMILPGYTRKRMCLPYLKRSYILNRIKLDQLIFMALCCDCGLIAKKLISPAANIVTESIHIPGGIATGFSLMFIVVAASVVRFFGCATIMSVIQSLLALSFGMVGSMGVLAPIGYIIPGIIIDICLYLAQKTYPSQTSGITIASILSSVSACLVANILVFNLHGIVLLVYVFVSATTGAVCSIPACILTERLSHLKNISPDKIRKEESL